jgi:solute carrier family 25 folate transporter 32
MYASLSGGTCSTLVTNPIWVIKTRLMSQSDANTKSNHVRAPWHYRNTLDAAVKMYTAEGLKSFYSGLTPALLGLSHVAIQFPLYEVFKVKFTGVDPNNPPAEGEQKGQFWAISAAVFLSKVIASTATYPHEVVRTRLQTQQRSDPHHATENLAYRGAPGRDGDSVRPTSGTSSNSTANKSRYRGTIQTCKAILLEEGWRGFYAGLGTNLIRAVPSAMTTLLTFEYLKKAFVTSREDALSRA